MEKAVKCTKRTAHAALLRDTALETLWPTRCAICDAPGTLLCRSCYRSLPFIDGWQACPRCGSPFGRVQCCECNPVTLGAIGMAELPFDACASTLLLTERVRRIVTAYKDGGEQRLARVIALLMAPTVSPEWRARIGAVSFVPAGRASLQRRGFDHAEGIAGELARQMGRPCVRLLARPAHRDQRELSRAERLRNLSSGMQALPGTRAPGSLLLIDDVYTTGATLFSASAACKEAGAHTVYCATFARTDVEPTQR